MRFLPHYFCMLKLLCRKPDPLLPWLFPPILHHLQHLTCVCLNPLKHTHRHLRENFPGINISIWRVSVMPARLTQTISAAQTKGRIGAGYPLCSQGAWSRTCHLQLSHQLLGKWLENLGEDLFPPQSQQKYHLLSQQWLGEQRCPL